MVRTDSGKPLRDPWQHGSKMNGCLRQNPAYRPTQLTSYYVVRIRFVAPLELDKFVNVVFLQLSRLSMRLSGEFEGNLVY